MTTLHAIVLGIIEGITEFLPISSTGHLMLASTLLKLQQTEFQKSFEIIIQLGAILSVVVLYWKKLWEWGTIKKLIAAFVPTAVLGALFYKIVKGYLLNSNLTVLWALFLGGVFLVGFEWWYGRREGILPRQPADQNDSAAVANSNEIENISYQKSFIIGLFQSLAMIPGVSRSAATIVGGLILGLKRKTIVEFSFLLAVPTMLAASVLDLCKSAGSFVGADWGALAVGFIVSFVVAIGVIKWLLHFIQKHSFIGFGIYRILVSIAFWLVLW
ncbi:MAG: undecaprenyl-diphosphate phosphatase [Candidatus Magasanikbacteria bacterium]